jgi:alkanesulfonate monooxygenase SsuD/methylene tetrahydromethanopterin reductase-like flavin-dependent oxidoreductase (luciferase family)
MDLGIGLPAAVPGADMTLIGEWAAKAESAGFRSVGVIDRLVYDNLEPLTALAAAAARTRSIALTTTVANVCWRANPVLMAKQLASVTRLSGGRLCAGLGMGGWPMDYEASGISVKGRRALFEISLAAMEASWSSAERPRIFLAGTVDAAFARAAEPISEGWVAPLFGLGLLEEGVAAVRDAWSVAGRDGSPRIVSGRYFCLGENAADVADSYIRHYYGDEYFGYARADTSTCISEVEEELARLADAGCDEVVLYPCSGELEQVTMLAEGLVDQL